MVASVGVISLQAGFVLNANATGNPITSPVTTQESPSPSPSTAPITSPEVSPSPTANPSPSASPSATPSVTPSPTPGTYLVKPYLVYPADKPMYPEYETAVNAYMDELKLWYLSKVGKTFNMAPLQVVRSAHNYDTMRCDPNPDDATPPIAACLADPSRLDGNWGMYMNRAIHNDAEVWESQTAALIFGAGGGGFAGANKYPNDTGFAIVGDWALEPISGVVNSWGIPCSFSDGWQCVGGVPKGTPAHELGHAFGLPHPGAQYVGQSIMQWHGDYPTVGLIQQEIDQLNISPFFTSQPNPSPSPSLSPSPSTQPSPSPSTAPITSPEVSPSPSSNPSNNPSNNGGGNGGGGNSGGGSTSAPTCDNESPKSAPKIISAITSGTGEITLTWERAKNPVTHYLIAYGMQKGKPLYGNPDIGNTGKYTVKGLSGGATYYFKVRAGNGCKPGEFSNEIAVKVGGKFQNVPAQGFKPGVLGKTLNNKPALSKPVVFNTVNETKPNMGLAGKVFNYFKGLFN